jgi:hypothetical protein
MGQHIMPAFSVCTLHDKDGGSVLLLSAFEKLRKAAISLCPSIWPHGETCLLMDEFSLNFIFEYSVNMSRKFMFD